MPLGPYHQQPPQQQQEDVKERLKHVPCRASDMDSDKVYYSRLFSNLHLTVISVNFACSFVVSLFVFIYIEVGLGTQIVLDQAQNFIY